MASVVASSSRHVSRWWAVVALVTMMSWCLVPVPRSRALAYSPTRVRALASSTTTRLHSTASAGTPPPPLLQLYYNDVYKVDLPPKHRFPMPKYAMARKVVQSRVGSSGLVTFTQSPLAKTADLETTHCPEYIRRFLSNEMTERENRVVGFPWSEQSVNRTLSSVGGTVQAMHAVCRPTRSDGRPAVWFSGHMAGGTHHAFRDRGEGFCYFSDIAVAANVALRDYPHLIRSILIIDLDVHQGNGNAVLFKDDPRVYTFSMHCRGNYFSKKEHSDLDVELDPGTSDGQYMSTLRRFLPSLVLDLQPDLIFFQAGVDPLKSDRLGQLSISREGLRERNALVYESATLGGVNRRLVVTMGGGYPLDLEPSAPSYQDIVQAHADVYLGAAFHLAKQGHRDTSWWS